MYADRDATHKTCLDIINYVSIQVAYDAGFKFPICGMKYFKAWNHTMDNTIEIGFAVEIANICPSNHKVTVSTVHKIESAHSGHLHRLFRYAQKAKGSEGILRAIGLFIE